jgi:aminoglycoside 6'-N-acetyltransferase I
MSITIHHVSPANADLLGNVDPDVFDHAIAPAQLATYLADPRHAMFVAVEADFVIGQIRGSVHLQPDRASDLYIDNLGTAPSHQRRGVATRLINAMLAWGKAQGCTYAWVATETDNGGAQGFYAAQRFTHDNITMFALEMD